MTETIPGLPAIATDGLGRAHWEVINPGDKLTEKILEMTAADMSERDIAKELGVSKSTVHRKKQKA